MGSRSVGLGLALTLALAAASPAHALTVTYDLSGTSTYRTASGAAPDSRGYFETPLLPGSTLTVELDANGDGAPGDVTLVESHMSVEETFPFFPASPLEFVITTDVELALTGGAGLLWEPSNPEWSPTMIDWYASATQSVIGTARCSGPGCYLLGLTDGVDLPYEELLPRIANAELNPEAALGTWAFTGWPDGDAELRDGCIDRFDWTCDSGPGVVLAVSGAGAWVTAVRILGVAVPEPASAALVALVALALALRRHSPGLLAGLALLAAAAPSHAATITYDLSGTSTYRTADGYAPGPLGYFETPLSPGSTLTLELEANGNVALIESHMRVEEILPFYVGAPFELVITTDLELELTGGAGLLSGPAYPDSTPAMIDWSTSPSLSIRGTARCSGAGCDLFGLAQGVDLPYDELLQGIWNAAPTAPLLGTWGLTGQPDLYAELREGCIDRFDWTCDYGPGVVVTRGELGEWRTAVRILGVAVPEPASAWLVAAALAALALRRIA